MSTPAPIDAMLVAINAGSTSVKFATHAVAADGSLALRTRGGIDSLQGEPRFTASGAARNSLGGHAWDRALDPLEALRFVADWLRTHLEGVRIVGMGHRVVLGGERFAAPVRLEDGVLDALEALAAMEPSHQAINVRGARLFAAEFPGVPQVACFDNTFHATMPDAAKTYALPRDVRDAGVRHWGFHGLSYESIAARLPTLVPGAGRVVVAHLGGGSSLCAMREGRSVETTMGFGALSGLPMATRSGDVPPEALLYLLRERTFDAASLEHTLYERAGLLGLSGVSGDMRVLEASEDPRAIAAIAHFVHAATRHAGACVAVLGGLDALVFTGGVGEHSARVRAALCARLAWLGIELDPDANRVGGPRISTPASRVSAWVIPADEEGVIARHTLALAGTGNGAAA